MQPFFNLLHQRCKLKNMKPFFYLTLLLCATLAGCKDKIYSKHTANVPIYLDYSTFRSSITFESPKNISKQGSIFVKDDFLFIIEPQKGIHFINNANPSSPQKVGFLNVMGCTGMSIKGNYLYVNSMIDLVTIDISDKNHPVVADRIEDLFPQALPATNNNYRIAAIDKSKGIVFGWEVKQVKEEVTETPIWYNCPTCETMTGNVPLSGSSGSSTGISGSITKFAVMNERLYIMDNYNLLPINISNPSSPAAGNPVYVPRQVETLFAGEEYLFMGTTNGMLIYSVSNPDIPAYLNAVDHVTGCDPVVVQGDYAYVTIRTGTTCIGEFNELQVVDISNASAPFVAGSFTMENPHGLGIDGSRLFICDGSAGLKLFDASNPINCGNQLTAQFGTIQATDVIPFNNTAIVIGENGLYQYDYSDPQNLQLLSTISFQ
jgi:hypothetical protein